ncbi:MAG: SH3 domain-containing C40 family peptidase [bacterium]|nr:SH3 domain-containing C40 family peptidase [bacterium]
MEKRALVISPIAPYYVKPSLPPDPDDEGWYGQIVEILEQEQDGFYKIRTPYRYETYVHESHLCLDEAEVERWEKADLRRVWAAWADIQVTDGATHPYHICLCRGAVVEYVAPPEKPQGWAKVRLIGGAEGYVREGFLGRFYDDEPSAGEEELRNSVVEAAKLYMGVQYRWGGKTPQGIDCSGLVGAAYLLNGVKLYRNASIEEGFPVHEIDRAKMKKGDLLFFKGHVAMYIGDGMYIHSTSRAGADGVVLNSLCPGHPLYRDDLAKGVLAVGSIF